MKTKHILKVIGIASSIVCSAVFTSCDDDDSSAVTLIESKILKPGAHFSAKLVSSEEYDFTVSVITEKLGERTVNGKGSLKYTASNGQVTFLKDNVDFQYTTNSNQEGRALIIRDLCSSADSSVIVSSLQGLFKGPVKTEFDNLISALNTADEEVKLKEFINAINEQNTSYIMNYSTGNTLPLSPLIVEGFRIKIDTNEIIYHGKVVTSPKRGKITSSEISPISGVILNGQKLQTSSSTLQQP